MDYQFSDDHKYVYISDNGVITGIPVEQLTENQKQLIFQEMEW